MSIAQALNQKQGLLNLKWWIKIGSGVWNIHYLYGKRCQGNSGEISTRHRNDSGF